MERSGAPDGWEGRGDEGGVRRERASAGSSVRMKVTQGVVMGGVEEGSGVARRRGEELGGRELRRLPGASLRLGAGRRR